MYFCGISFKYAFVTLHSIFRKIGLCFCYMKNLIDKNIYSYVNNSF